MTKTMNHNGTDYRIKRHRTYGRYVEIPIELVSPGMKLDQGTFTGYEPAMFQGATNPRTWDVCLADGLRYTETRGAFVRVWIDE
jgi:hypothetical protein